ncbi:MAG: type I secretion system permease/ATPase, partial [Gammaproteobacteria bacterium]|nr:type I secretion system permease/ATPase [Gammaproteobacteria bacterium]
MTETSNKQKANNWKLGADTDTSGDPLLDCLELLAKLEGRPTTRTTMRAGLPLVDNRLTVELFPRAANRAGLSTRVLRRSLTNLSNMELPAVLLLKSGQACVAVSVNTTEMSVKVLLPQSGMGEQEFSLDELDELYSGYAIFARPKFHPEQQTLSDIDAQPDKDWFWGTLASSWRIYRDALVASLLINIFALMSPFFILNVYDRVVPNQAFETLWVLAIGMSIIYLFDLVIRGLRAYFIDVAGKKAELRLSSMLFEKVMGLRMEVRPKSVGAFSKNLQEFDSVRDFITSFSVTALIDMPFALLGLAAIWYLAGSMVWVLIVAILILLIFAAFIQIP